MKSLIQAVVVAAALAAPVAVFAQSNAPDTGAAVQNSAGSSYGGVADETSASGSHHPLRALDHSIIRSIRWEVRFVRRFAPTPMTA